MIVLDEEDLISLLGEKRALEIVSRASEPGYEVVLFVCSNDQVFFGHVRIDQTKILDMDKFIPSPAYSQMYADLPYDKLLPCPLCGYPPSTIRVENVAGSLRVYSS